jgi:hypothetical protein
MWNSTPQITFYYYHHYQAHIYGDSKAWDFNIASGIWYKITIRVVRIDFDDFVAFTYKDNVIAPRGNTTNPPGRILIHPYLRSFKILLTVNSLIIYN